MAALMIVLATAGVLTAHPGASTRAHAGPAPATIDGIRVDHIVAPARFYEALSRLHGGTASLAVPAFSRQTGLACSACHYEFPQLTPFGRIFKLNGYTMTGLKPVRSPGDSAGRETLALLPIPPVAAMIVGSVTRLATAAPGTQNSTVSFPDQASLFVAGAVTPRIGAFTQFTYSGTDGTFGIDNVDIRYATHATFAAHDLLVGATVNNNPTVQDVWNTAPAWGFPFMASSVAPGPAATTLMDGPLAQQVMGVGAYALYDNLLYVEGSAYRSAQQGHGGALDSTASSVTRGVAPYWRVALQHQSGSTYAMLGTSGLLADIYPVGVSGPTNQYVDIGLDAQVEQTAPWATVIGRLTFLHEQQRLDALAVAAPAAALPGAHTLSTVRANVSVLPGLRYGATLGYFRTSGTADSLVYAPATLTGSRTGSPSTSGATAEFDVNLWQNFRVAMQYTAYTRFNGGTTEYDVARGRRAADNNTLFTYFWMAF